MSKKILISANLPSNPKNAILSCLVTAIRDMGLHAEMQSLKTGERLRCTEEGLFRTCKTYRIFPPPVILSYHPHGFFRLIQTGITNSNTTRRSPSVICSRMPPVNKLFP